MQFGNLNYLWVLWLIPLVVFFYWYSYKKKQFLINNFVSSELKERLLEKVSFRNKRLKKTLIILSLCLMVIALIRPKWGFHWEEVKRKGVDIMIALDVSRSMLASDVDPNRLERAKRKIMDFLDIIEGDRIGLIAFAGTSFIQCPLTLDYGALHIFLDEIDTDLIPVPGTALGEAIKTSIGSFEGTSKKSRVLILITDGEDHQKNVFDMAKKAKEEGIKIYTIGIGKKEGAPIPEKDGSGFKKNQKGEMVLSQLDEETLQKIALETGASYVRSVTGDLDLERIYDDIKKNLEQKELKSGKRKRYEERYQWPLFFAFLLLFLETLISERKKSFFYKRKISFPFKSNFFLFVFICLFYANNSRASIFSSSINDGEKSYQKEDYNQALNKMLDAQIENPNNLELKYNLGNTYYKLKQYSEAEKLFQSSVNSENKDLRKKSFYNLGNTYYRQGKLKEAIESYEQALKIDSDDADAKYNLNFVRNEIKKRLEQQKKTMQKQQQMAQNNSQNQQQQPQQQNQQQQNQENQPQNQQQQQQQAQQEKKEQSEQENQKEKKENSQSLQASANKDKDKNDEKKQNQGSAYKPANKKDEMSQEEAKRWMSTLKEDRAKYLKKRMSGSSSYQVEKDW